MKIPTELAILKSELRELRREMREKGIKRTSFMNGGLSPESSRFNCECFRLETLIKKLKSSQPLNREP